MVRHSQRNAICVSWEVFHVAFVVTGLIQHLVLCTSFSTVSLNLSLYTQVIHYCPWEMLRISSPEIIAFLKTQFIEGSLLLLWKWVIYHWMSHMLDCLRRRRIKKRLCVYSSSFPWGEASSDSFIECKTLILPWYTREKDKDFIWSVDRKERKDQILSKRGRRQWLTK